MVFYLAAFGLLFHILFWGIGLASILLPWRWRRFWPVLTAPAGLALQSAVVWGGAYSPLHGANAYAWGSELIPLALLIIGIRRTGVKNVTGDTMRFAGVGLAMLGTMIALILPFSMASHLLTTSSLGSCDAADYAAGARVLQEFVHTDRSGFLGLTEVVQVASADNFFDFWLRLNHFTPSALIALNGAAFHLQPYEIISVLTALLLVAAMPTVFWIARSGLRLRAGASLFVTVLYGFSPVTWYAVYHVAMGQLLAAPGIALVTWGGITLWRGGATWRLGLRFAGVLALAYWILWGSYNFIVIVCLVPAVAYAGGQTLWRRQWSQFFRWALLMGSPLLATGLVFTQRMLGLIERFQLFGQFDFGWKIPALSPEGWLGLVAQPDLSPFSSILRWLFGLALLVALTLAILRAVGRGRNAGFIAICFTAPILVGYAFLLMRGSLRGTNASYDAYKLLSVFYPSLLAGSCYWLTFLRGSPPLGRGLTWLAALGVLTINGTVGIKMVGRMRAPPLLVEPALPQLQRIEASDTVDSINLRVDDFWNRLWADAFLLRKPHYFLTHTYEGRRNTPLRGHWDLVNGIVTIKMPEENPAVARLNLPRDYSLLDTRDPHYLRVSLGDGWYGTESLSKARLHWRWTEGRARIDWENPQTRPLKISMEFRVRSLVPRDLQIWQNHRVVRTANVGVSLATVYIATIEVQPGLTTLELRSSTPPTQPGPNDERRLDFAVYGLAVQVQPDNAQVEP